MQRSQSKVMLIMTVLVLAVGITTTAGETEKYDVESEFRKTLKSLAPAPAVSAEELDDAIVALMDTYDIPGAQACVIVGDSIVWTGAYGFMDARQTEPVADSNLFLLASISKTVMTTALLQCVENGLVDLDTAVSAYLPFPVTNPYYATDTITCRMILAHVSSIDRNDRGANSWYWDMTYGEGDWGGDLSQYCFDYFDPSGPNYLETNYKNAVPGTEAQYSNWAFTLLALVVENVTGMGFEDYVQDSVFIPLNMMESSWFLDSLDTNNVAMPMDGPPKYLVGDYPRSAACADFDGSGFADIVTANHFSDDIAILLNNGDGTFAEKVTYAVGDGPSFAACGDLNGDTYIDLAVANSNSDNISILLNNGDGTFAPAVNYAGGDYPWSVFVSYLDTDAILDLAVTNGASNTVSVFIGNGDG
ncbi:MAG: serine hydrolase, partial [Candidatus Zixiibacteriota bacterium]